MHGRGNVVHQLLGDFAHRPNRNDQVEAKQFIGVRKSLQRIRNFHVKAVFPQAFGKYSRDLLRLMAVPAAPDD
ncbi:hypothetical protein D3C81_2286840 [compost metagenome]